MQHLAVGAMGDNEAMGAMGAMGVMEGNCNVDNPIWNKCHRSILLPLFLLRPSISIENLVEIWSVQRH